MPLTWKTVDKWREDKGMRKSDLARAAGIPENTIYRGIKHNSRLNPSMVRLIRMVFPDQFEEMERTGS
ncbi:helix-turn-helix domain-containing protein [Martelella mangrovi]|uniref:Transcriptional regulator n=1 Tax=Martelella mangrovi TaxID=1397477 RepID=A0ABV2IFR7_9HYPH